MLRAVLLLSAALTFGAAIGLVDPGTRTGFWLAMLAGFLGAWGCCPLSQPLLGRHKTLAGRAGADQVASGGPANRHLPP